jgi:hypothetical protein
LLVDVGASEAERGAFLLLGTVALSTTAWVTATLLSRPESDGTLRTFVERVQPFGPGWRAVYARLGIDAPVVDVRQKLIGFVAATTLVYAAVFGIGRFVLGSALESFGLLAVASAAFVVVMRAVGR